MNNKKELTILFLDDCYFRSDLFHATRQRAVHDRH